MHRLGRHGFILFSFESSVLCIGSIVLWIRSYWWCDYAIYLRLSQGSYTDVTQFGLWSENGAVELQVSMGLDLGRGGNVPSNGFAFEPQMPA